jgi:ribosomal protein S18 acetylase RimI-like enzyme
MQSAKEERSGSRPAEPVGSARGQAVRSRASVPSTTCSPQAAGVSDQQRRPERALTDEGAVSGAIPIRCVRPGDVDGILALARRTGVFTSEEIAVVRELVESQLSNPQQRDYRSLVSEADGYVVGFACYGPTPMTDGTYDLYWIFVHPSYQGRSIGAALLAEVETSVRQTGGRMLLVDTSSTRRYLPARRFYTSQGFRKSGEVKDFYRAGDSRIIYVKRFVQEPPSRNS